MNDDFDDFDADRLLFQLTIYNHRHRWIHTETMRLERESGTNYNRNDNQISAFGVMNDVTDAFRIMTYGRFNFFGTPAKEKTAFSVY